MRRVGREDKRVTHIKSNNRSYPRQIFYAIPLHQIVFALSNNRINLHLYLMKFKQKS
jgi:hypothetical protein